MKTAHFYWALYLIPILVLTGCNGRKILHGSSGASHIAAVHPAVTASCPTKSVRIWLVKSDGSGLKSICVERKSSGSNRFDQAVEELLRGPSTDEESTGIGTEIPRGTILLGIKRAGNDVDLNLSQRFAAGGGSSSFLMRLEQLRRTVTEEAGQANVFLSVEGHRLNVEEGEGIEIHQPINR